VEWVQINEKSGEKSTQTTCSQRFFFWNTKYDQLVANEIEYLNKAGLTRRNEKGGKAQLARYKIKILGG